MVHRAVPCVLRCLIGCATTRRSHVNDQVQFRPSVDRPRLDGHEPLSYDTFAQASDDVDATIVISSDWGLTTFLTVPANLVRCDARTLWLLLSDLDATYWLLGDTNLAVVSLLRAPVGCHLVASDGSVAEIVDGVWTHPHFAGEMHAQARDVVLGLSPRIDLTLLRAERDREIQRRKATRSTSPFALAWDFDIFPPTYLFKTFDWHEPGQD
jgi:hypothetical protein